jgi:hypothetical protein
LASWLIDGVFNATQLSALRQAQPSRWLRQRLADLELCGIGLVVWLLTAYLLWISPAHDALQFLARKGWIATAFGAIASGILFNAALEANKIPPGDPGRLGAFDRLRRRIAEGTPPRWLRWLVVVLAIPVGCLGGYLASRYLLVPLGEAIACAGSLVADGATIALERSLSWIPWTGAALAEGAQEAVEVVRSFFASHVKAMLFAMGLLSVTALLIVVLGALRWLFQPIPTR